LYIVRVLKYLIVNYYFSATKSLTSESSQILDINEGETIDDIVKREQKEFLNSPGGKKLQEKTKYVFSSSPTALFSLPECRTLVKVIICGIKTAVWGIATVKVHYC